MATESSVEYSRIPSRDEDPHTEARDPVKRADSLPPVIQVTPSEEARTPLFSPQEAAHDSEPIPVSPPATAHESEIDAVTQPLASRRTRSEPQPVRPVHTLHKEHRNSSLTAYKQRMQDSFQPSLHELFEKDEKSTTREYRYKTQRRRLLRLTIGEWVNTLILCVAYFGILYDYSKKPTIDEAQRRIFNALTTGNSLLLGVNLAASLRSYAKLLRWRMLAVCYRPLETFDLVMGCDSLWNVVQLLLKARNHRYKYLPSRTQIFCALWLLVHLAVTILVGIIGLNYNLNTSQDHELTKNGTTSILDLNALSTGDYLLDLNSVHEQGIRGESTLTISWNTSEALEFSYNNDGTGGTAYYFQDRNPEDSTQGIITTRYISAQAYCTNYTVTEGQYGNLSYVVYNDGVKNVNQSLPEVPGDGGLLIMPRMNSTCGQRCVDLNAFQAYSEYWGVTAGVYFICNNTVSQVTDYYGANLTSQYLVSDLVARMLAGAVGWNDIAPTAAPDGGFEEYQLYSNISDYGFEFTPGADDMANAVSTFTMGMISFLDTGSNEGIGGTRLNVTDGADPISAQVLEVTWRFAGAILGLIPFIHFVTLVLVIIWANKAIIKDDSHLAIAKVYHTLLTKMGDRGCLLRGEHIVEALDNPEVIYGWRPSNEVDKARHVDVFERGQGISPIDEPFVEGEYDGESRLSTFSDVQEESRQRRRYRDIDAAEYF
ncbi:hypothetical protein LTR10_019806 [Elasticomyces elasticus]|uniref:Uncharacterized protein n=1 Tax=Exophiala sideris TaxID=1016849 RepID=A0ABR0JCV3_9EURO|nr:hypothetical protein LTR10_019806 [Elasticomyces elasticus]KAK5032065.1 hypothetical protein LTS07_004687 [Exophiala sideris]KAK5040993.1 hypothetical protein LTR13_003295 [Exophiala sideris]KAK5061673.1 hypothetical protein LTR69_004855 [Exophiala sideris]KAK5184373.1 hypothetical protein LTR44_003046 [Eurotiomycetes sp. CCFEE 6388]